MQARLLLVLAVLAGLLVGGLAGPAVADGQTGSRAPAATALRTVSGPAAAAPRGSRATPSRPAATHDAASGERTPHPPLPPVLPLPPAAVVAPPLLLGQLPRPPSTQSTGADPVAVRGRAPPTSAGT